MIPLFGTLLVVNTKRTQFPVKMGALHADPLGKFAYTCLLYTSDAADDASSV